MITPTESVLVDVEQLLEVAALSLIDDEHEAGNIYFFWVDRIADELSDDRLAVAWEVLANVIVAEVVRRGCQAQLEELVGASAEDSLLLIVDHFVADATGDLPPNYSLALDFAFLEAINPRWLASVLPLIVQEGLRVIVLDQVANGGGEWERQSRRLAGAHNSDEGLDLLPLHPSAQTVLHDIAVLIQRLRPAAD